MCTKQSYCPDRIFQPAVRADGLRKPVESYRIQRDVWSELRRSIPKWEHVENARRQRNPAKIAVRFSDAWRSCRDVRGANEEVPFDVPRECGRSSINGS